MGEHGFIEQTTPRHRGETVLPVWIENWEIECCAPRPVVGRPSTLSLFFVPAPPGDSGGGIEQVWSCTTRPFIPPGKSEPCGAVLDIGGAAVFRLPDRADATQLSQGACELRGHLAGTWHGGLIPEEVGRTTGIVRRLRIVGQSLIRVTGERVPGTMTLTDRRRSPGSFQRGSFTPGDEQRWLETGVLLDLAVRSPAPS